ncbi:hypothetical protein SLEP1_g25040 [Rubroshorea leprosula]|uniref:Uncharacterized protein n=1 Tax=Rubroshorea leprosula TaxID=152421 RepID=A0AAV5JUY4_9ROSI|nr:hypothetical protein SLEP1_g25040 [Rubroshorea leprosula]
MIFPYFLVQEPDLEPRNLPPLLEKPDLPCSALSFRRLLLIVGDFWAFFSLAAGFFPLLGPVLAGKFWFQIVLSVSA